MRHIRPPLFPADHTRHIYTLIRVYMDAVAKAFRLMTGRPVRLRQRQLLNRLFREFAVNVSDRFL